MARPSPGQGSRRAAPLSLNASAMRRPRRSRPRTGPSPECGYSTSPGSSRGRCAGGRSPPTGPTCSGSRRPTYPSWRRLLWTTGAASFGRTWTSGPGGESIRCAAWSGRPICSSRATVPTPSRSWASGPRRLRRYVPESSTFRCRRTAVAARGASAGGTTRSYRPQAGSVSRRPRGGERRPPAPPLPGAGPRLRVPHGARGDRRPRETGDRGRKLAREGIAGPDRTLDRVSRADRARLDLPAPTVPESCLETTDSGFGRLTAVSHAAQMSATPAAWTRPSAPLGAHPAVWPE